jgi:hypothetical protein
MTETMIEETEAEDFTDELADEALDREGLASNLLPAMDCMGPTGLCA